MEGLPLSLVSAARLEAEAEYAHAMLLAGRWLGGDVNYYGVRASLYPIVEDLELNWWEDPARREEIVALFNKLIMQSDTPNNLHEVRSDNITKLSSTPMKVHSNEFFK